MQENHSDWSRVAQHAMVLGPSGHVQPNSTKPTQPTRSITQLLNQTPPRNLSNLNLVAWLLEPQQSRSRASLKQWQHKWRPLREDQPDQSMRQSHQLTKAPFEPIKEASLKHLTFKTVFLLALGLGKRWSEIHAWQNKNIRHQSEWSKVSLYPAFFQRINWPKRVQAISL